MAKVISAGLALTLILSFGAFGQDAEPQATTENAMEGAAVEKASEAVTVELSTKKEKVSYALGLNIGASLMREMIDVDLASLAKGIADAISGAKPILGEAELQQVMTAFEQEMQGKQQKMQERMMEAAAKNTAEGQAFLADNAKREGVVTLPSGLQYEVITEGTGATPTATDTVSVNYVGTLIDGTVFDASERHGGPATFPVNGVISGWTEALQLMTVGSKWKLYIPADLAYGPRGSGRAIGPNATLIFEVELLSIEGAAE